MCCAGRLITKRWKAGRGIYNQTRSGLILVDAVGEALSDDGLRPIGLSVDAAIDHVPQEGLDGRPGDRLKWHGS
jgi:hypothetical protein